MRTILHLDLDAFYCAVEERRDPSLRGKAFAVGGSPDGRGVVASCSYEARRYGVRSAMPMGRARGLCPGLLCLPCDFSAYRAASAEVMARVRGVTPLVEQISIDEAFMDVSALREPGIQIARRLQDEIRNELGLSCSLGIATNKLVAKIATDVGKMRVGTGASPQAICEAPPGGEAAFLDPLPADALWGVGGRTSERLAELGVRTIGDIARWPEADLRRRFGKHGDFMARHARGLDDRPIVTERDAKSMSKETTFARDVTDGDMLRQTLRAQVRQVCAHLKKDGVCGGTVKLKIRWSDFTTLTRQFSVPHPTDQESVILPLALKLLDQIWPEGRPVRLLGVGVGNLEVPLQLNLWDTRPAEEAAKAKKVDATLNALRERFGESALRRAQDLLEPPFSNGEE
ncbi:DNA polymerase IV [Capsulimonas corticalis]|uniref:DNA polymerase IV n=1 Tax=Capsulimonas corticalis TaxID=2219043 RepID=A0A402CQY8_9BACT|nr:DNA polymerase IV [Capsulimonas corticalis]BDI34520.1 DNA polymerase IV [Capsulimonas corticalis]